MNIPWISTDTLETIVSRYVPRNRYPKLFPKNILRERTRQSNDKMYTRYTALQISRAYITQAKTVWPAIELFIVEETYNEHNFIIEGHHIHPRLVKRLMKKHQKLKSVFLGRENINEIVTSARTYSSPTDWFVTKTKDERIYYKIAGMISAYSSYFRKEAKKQNLTYIDMGKDFKECLSKATRLFTVIK